MSSEEDIVKLRQDYRLCFTSPAGKVVLKHMLYEMRFFNDNIEADDQDGRVLRNYASLLIERLGCADSPDKTLDVIIDAITTLPIKITEEE